jgi:hypothetical protein
VSLKSLLQTFIRVTPDMTSHVEGVREGNSVGNYEKQPGHAPNGKSTAERSTGINAAERDPILPQMQNISPP